MEVLYEILDGKSEIKLDKKVVFFKHPSIFAHLKQDKLIELYRERGKKSGILPEAALIEEASNNGSWSKERDEEVRMTAWELGRMQASFPKIKEPFLRKQAEQRINEIDSQLSSLKKERDDITRFSLERYSLIKTSLACCAENLYEDEGLTKKIKSGDEGVFLTPYISKIQELSSKENLLTAAYKPEMMNLLFLFQENPYQIFAQNIYEMSIFKKELLVYGVGLLSKLKNSDIPDSIKNDPIRIFDWQKTDKDEYEGESLRSLAQRKGGLNNLTANDKLT